MIRSAALSLLLLLTLGRSLCADSRSDAYDLRIDNGPAGTLKLRLHLELEGQPLAAVEKQLLHDWLAFCAGGSDGRLDARTAARALRFHPAHLLVPAELESADWKLEAGTSLTLPEAARQWQERSLGRLLHLDAHPARQPHGELLTRALVEALDRNHDGKLTKEELRAAEKVLLEKDADEDECLTPFELAPSLLLDELPEKVSITPKVRLSPPSQGKEDRPDQDITVRLDRPGQRQLFRVGGLLLDVGTQPFLSTTSEATLAQRKLEAAADGDGDGKASAAERRQYLALYRKTADSIVTLTVSTRPRSWFVLLDANGDGQLSRKEQRCAWERLADAEARKAGFIPAPDWSAPVLTLTFVRGVRGAADTPLQKRLAPPRGPSWFQAMDRNGDGYVSSSEFIGTERQFRQLDRDGDELLSPEEAEAAR